MTYCVGLLVDTGLVMLSDSRTNAGVDQINTFRKMATFQQPNDRVLVLMSAGNLGITQAVINLLEAPDDFDLASTRPDDRLRREGGRPDHRRAQSDRDARHRQPDRRPKPLSDRNGYGFRAVLSVIKGPETYDRFEKIVLLHGCRRVAELAYGEMITEKLPQDE